MADQAQLSAFLDHLAKWFEDHQQVPEEVPQGRGWGQFLDSPLGHTQIGLYGTSAGMIVRALAGRGPHGLTDNTVTLVQHWWSQRDTDVRLKQFFGQIPRLAFFNLALRIADYPELQSLREEVEQALMGRLLPNGLWGNYWMSDQLQDPTPRLVPSSIALLSFTLFSKKSERNETLIRIATELEQKLIGYHRLPVLHAALAATAILATRGGASSRKVRSRIARVAYAGPRELADLGVYFYEYSHLDATRTVHSGRDYFIVPTEILVGLLGRLPYSPGAIQQRSKDCLRALTKNLSESDGAYRAPEQRVSSKNQAWTAMLLKLSTEDENPSDRFGKILYILRKRRWENRFTDDILPIIVLIVTTFATTLISEPFQKGILTVSAVVLAALYPPTVLRRFITGQE